MAETTNYKLYIENNDQTFFRDWREKINGTKDSNMIKIDTALHDISTSLNLLERKMENTIQTELTKKADKSVSSTALLLADGWLDTGLIKYQDVVIPNMRLGENGIAMLDEGVADINVRDAARNALLYVGEQKSIGSEVGITVICDGEIPSVDIPIRVLLFD